MNAFNHDPFTPTRPKAYRIVGDYVLEGWELTSASGNEECLTLHFDIELSNGDHFGHLTHAPLGDIQLNRGALVSAFGEPAIRSAEDAAATRFSEGDQYDGEAA